MSGLAPRVRSALRHPIVAARRRRHSDVDPLARQMLEAVDYRRSMFDFMWAFHQNPAILLEAGIDETSCVVDAGAFVGEWSVEIAQRYGSTIVAFEPAPVYWAVLEERMREVPNVSCRQVALGRRDGHAMLALKGPGSTLMGETGVADSVDVEVRDVAAVLDALEVERLQLLKLNIEGGEFDVLERLIETEWLTRIDELLIQFHPGHPKGRRRRRSIRRALGRSHQEVWNYPWVWERWVRRIEPT